MKRFNLFSLMVITLFFSINSYSGVEDVDNNIQTNWTNKYSKEKSIVINNRLKKSFEEISILSSRPYYIQNDISKIIGVEINKDKLDGFRSLRDAIDELNQHMNKIEDLFYLFLLMRSDDDRKILSWRLRFEIKNEIDYMKRTEAIKKSDFLITYNAFNDDPVFDIFKDKYINLSKKYYAWLLANSSI